MFKWHMQKIFDFAPSTIEWLEENHPRIWYRCGFSELSKCDYLTNNVSESFNAQIKHLKGLHLHELVDRIRELIMEKGTSEGSWHNNGQMESYLRLSKN
jgi:hypothetical protein